MNVNNNSIMTISKGTAEIMYFISSRVVVMVMMMMMTDDMRMTKSESAIQTIFVTGHTLAAIVVPAVTVVLVLVLLVLVFWIMAKTRRVLTQIVAVIQRLN